MSDSPQQWFDGRARLVALPERVDARGALLPLDFDALPFEPRRLIFVHDVPAQATRGGHAHRRSRQLLVRLAGTIDVELRTATASARLRLERSDVGLLVEPGVWTAQTYAEGASLLLVASEPWSADSYSEQPIG